MEVLRNSSSKVGSVRQATLRLRVLASRTEPIVAQQVKQTAVPTNGIAINNQFPLPGNVASQVAYNTTYGISSTDVSKAQVTAMECPEAMLKKAQELFPKQNLKGLSVVNFVQKTENDMSKWSAKMELEFAGLTSNFTQTAAQTCEALRNMGYWADFIDPFTGKAYINESKSDATLTTTDVEYRSMGFEVTDMVCCKVLSHPLFGKYVFVGTVFTNAPTDVLSSLGH